MNSSIDWSLQSRAWLPGIVIGVLGSALLVAMAWPLLDHLPLYDELLHVLAARGLNEQGVPMIADGFYERAPWFTAIVATSIAYLGDTLAAARVPSLLASIALLMLITIWVVRRVDLLAGATAAAVLCLLPVTLDLAVFARFYTLHALLVAAMAIAFYEALTPERTLVGRCVLGAAAAIALVLALHFQVTTLIAFGAAAVGIGAVLLLDRWTEAWSFMRRHPVVTAVGVTAVVGSGLFVLTRVGFVDALRAAPLWASWSANRPQYYLIALGREVPLLWPLFPAAALVALAGRRRFAVFCIVTFLFALAVHSIAGAKSMRYVYYALPFFAVAWGCALSSAYAYASRLELRGPMLRGPNAAAAGMLIVAAAVIVLSQEGQRAARAALGRGTDDGLVYGGELDWGPAVPTLQPLVASATRVVTSNAMKALYYFGRYDYELNASIVAETDTGEEFGLDERTGRQAIGTAESTAQVLAMPGRAIMILEEEKLDNPVGVPANAVETIAARCSILVVPAAAGLRAWSCPADVSSP